MVNVKEDRDGRPMRIEVKVDGQTERGSTQWTSEDLRGSMRSLVDYLDNDRHGGRMMNVKVNGSRNGESMRIDVKVDDQPEEDS